MGAYSTYKHSGRRRFASATFGREMKATSTSAAAAVVDRNTMFILVYVNSGSAQSIQAAAEGVVKGGTNQSRIFVARS